VNNDDKPPSLFCAVYIRTRRFVRRQKQANRKRIRIKTQNQKKTEY